MVYESQISFTLDTICPWTYLAKKRLDEAIRQVTSDPPNAAKVTFTKKYNPYQLYPSASKEGEDNGEMKMYTTLMTAYGVSAGISYKFGGLVANTLDAHRVIHYFQEQEMEERKVYEGGKGVADRLVNSLYKQYFEEEKHPSSEETLLRACREAGIEDEEAKRAVGDESEGLMDVKMAIREQVGNGVDSVPLVVVEGRRRDVTLEGAREVEEYKKALEQVIKESS